MGRSDGLCHKCTLCVPSGYATRAPLARETPVSLGGESLDKMKSDLDLMTLAKASKDAGISAGILRKAFKEGGVKPDLVKAGCSYYSKTTVDGIVKKLKKA